MNKLSNYEEHSLDQCEAVILQNRAATLETLDALIQAEDKQLYRAAGHETMDDFGIEFYGREVWEIAKSLMKLRREAQ